MLRILFNNYFLCHLTQLVLVSLGLSLGLLSFDSVADDSPMSGRKILHINSYHAGYQWSDGITHGIQSRFQLEDVWLETHYMDTKRNRSVAYIQEAAIQAKKRIEQLHPDVVIVSDDNAAKYLLAPYYKNSSLPFVYCGINWNAQEYGLPFKNTTGMVEINLIESLVDLLSRYAYGKKLGFLSINSLSGKRMLDHYGHALNQYFDRAYFVESVAEWESSFIRLQNEVDILIIESPEGIDGWTMERAIPFVEAQTRIPAGSVQEWLTPLSMISMVSIPEEQGWWAAEQAVNILHGVRPADIPEAVNRQGKLLLNLKMANKLGITFSAELLQTATLISE